MNNTTSNQEKNNSNSKRDVVKFIEHRPIIFWWPIWFFGYIFAGITRYYGDDVIFTSIQSDGANVYTLLNLIYITLILLIIYFTNVKTDFQTSLIIFGAAVLAVFTISHFNMSEWLSSITPEFKIYMNSNFYFWFSTGVLVIWVLIVLIIERRRYWFVKAGNIGYEQHLQEGVVYTLENAHVAHSTTNIPCHYILGLGLIGDVTLGVGPESKKHVVKNVFWFRSKKKRADDILGAAPH